MIARPFLIEWQTHAPWSEFYQVEQDLVLSKALVQIFSDPLLKESLAFRGGTALQKVIFEKPSRYSEDIDLVQIKAEPIGATLNALKLLIDPWLGKPKTILKDSRVKLIYRFMSEIEPVIPMRLKIEINTGEHFNVFPLQKKPLNVENTWFQGQAEITLYKIEELLGTKLRALFQRKKGRDLYDMSMALKYIKNLDCEKVVECFQRYIEHQGLSVSRAEFEANIYEKLNDDTFINDIFPLLSVDVPTYDSKAEGLIVGEKFISLLSGDPWKGVMN